VCHCFSFLYPPSRSERWARRSGTEGLRTNWIGGSSSYPVRQKHLNGLAPSRTFINYSLPYTSRKVGWIRPAKRQKKPERWWSMLLTERVLEIDTARNHSAKTQETLRRFIGLWHSSTSQRRTARLLRVFYIHVSEPIGKLRRLSSEIEKRSGSFSAGQTRAPPAVCFPFPPSARLMRPACGPSYAKAFPPRIRKNGNS